MYRIELKGKKVLGTKNLADMEGILKLFIAWGKVEYHDRNVALARIPKKMKLLEEEGYTFFYQYTLRKINVN